MHVVLLKGELCSIGHQFHNLFKLRGSADKDCREGLQSCFILLGRSCNSKLCLKVHVHNKSLINLFSLKHHINVLIFAWWDDRVPTLVMTFNCGSVTKRNFDRWLSPLATKFHTWGVQCDFHSCEDSKLRYVHWWKAQEFELDSEAHEHRNLECEITSRNFARVYPCRLANSWVVSRSLQVLNHKPLGAASFAISTLRIAN